MKNADKPANPVAYIAEYPTSAGYEKRDEVFFGLTKLEHFSLELAKALIASGRHAPFADISKEAIKAAEKLLTDLEKKNEI